MVNFKVKARTFLVDGDRSYRPGEEITTGQLYDLREYYAVVGCVEVVWAPTPADPVEQPVKAEHKATAKKKGI